MNTYVPIYTHVHVHTISAELAKVRQRFFSVRVQKLNNFSFGRAEIGEKQSRQSNSKYNFMQQVFFEQDI